MNTTITVTTKLSVKTCASCGGVFAITQDFIDRARLLGRFKQMWACPYCKTTWGYGESSTDKLNAQIAAAEAEKQRLRDSIAYERKRKEEAAAEAEHFRRSRDGMKGVLSKVKKRVGKGVCPCCNRYFADLHRHMTSKHPDVSGGEVDTTAKP